MKGRLSTQQDKKGWLSTIGSTLSRFITEKYLLREDMIGFYKVLERKVAINVSWVVL